MIWLAESIFACNSRTWFFLDMQSSQNYKDNYGALFKPKKSTYQWTKFFVKSKNLYFGIFLDIIPKMRFSPKNTASSILPLRHAYNFCLCINKFVFLAQQMFFFQNSSNTPLIKCTEEICRTCRILGNLGKMKYKAGIST